MAMRAGGNGIGYTKLEESNKIEHAYLIHLSPVQRCLAMQQQPNNGIRTNLETVIQNQLKADSYAPALLMEATYVALHSLSTNAVLPINLLPLIARQHQSDNRRPRRLEKVSQMLA